MFDRSIRFNKIASIMLHSSLGNILKFAGVMDIIMSDFLVSQIRDHISALKSAAELIRGEVEDYNSSVSPDFKINTKSREGFDKLEDIFESEINIEDYTKSVVVQASMIFNDELLDVIQRLGNYSSEYVRDVLKVEFTLSLFFSSEDIAEFEPDGSISRDTLNIGSVYVNLYGVLRDFDDVSGSEYNNSITSLSHEIAHGIQALSQYLGKDFYLGMPAKVEHVTKSTDDASVYHDQYSGEEINRGDYFSDRLRRYESAEDFYNGVYNADIASHPIFYTIIENHDALEILEGVIMSNESTLKEFYEIVEAALIEHVRQDDVEFEEFSEELSEDNSEESSEEFSEEFSEENYDVISEDIFNRFKNEEISPFVLLKNEDVLRSVINESYQAGNENIKNAFEVTSEKIKEYFVLRSSLPVPEKIKRISDQNSKLLDYINEEIRNIFSSSRLEGEPVVITKDNVEDVDNSGVAGVSLERLANRAIKRIISDMGVTEGETVSVIYDFSTSEYKITVDQYAEIKVVPKRILESRQEDMTFKERSDVSKILGLFSDQMHDEDYDSVYHHIMPMEFFTRIIDSKGEITELLMNIYNISKNKQGDIRQGESLANYFYRISSEMISIATEKGSLDNTKRMMYKMYEAARENIEDPKVKNYFSNIITHSLIEKDEDEIYSHFDKKNFDLIFGEDESGLGQELKSKVDKVLKPVMKKRYKNVVGKLFEASGEIFDNIIGKEFKSNEMKLLSNMTKV